MTLSPRQQQIAELVVQGKSNKAIAEKLGISPNSVGAHMDRLSKRLGGSGAPRAKVYRWWYESGHAA